MEICGSIMTRFGCLLALLVSSQLSHAMVVRIAAVERQPYSGESLPQNGMVNELVVHSYQATGVVPQVTFYPLARALRLLENGNVDVVVPVLADTDPLFSYSPPIPGGETVVLKYRNTHINIQTWRTKRQTSVQLSLLRGSPMTLANQQHLAKPPILVSEEFQQLGLLQKKRVDAVIMDKFTAADLMVTHMPSLIGQLDYFTMPEVAGGLHLAFNPKSSNSMTARDLFEEGMAALKTNGRVQQIVNKYGFYPSRSNSDGRTELVIGAVDINMVNRLMALTEHYERINPDVKVQWRVMDETTLRKRLLGDIAINDGQFDLVMVGDYEVMVWGEKGWLVPLNAEMTADVSKDLIPIAARRLHSPNGLYALPLQSETSVTVYRKDIFDALGLTMPAQPSYEEILALANEINGKLPDVHGLGFRAKPGWGQSMAFVTVLAQAYGGEWFDHRWRPQLTTEAWRKAVNLYVKALREAGPQDPTKYGWKENIQLFAEGKMAILVDASSAINRLYDPAFFSEPQHIGFAFHPGTGNQPGVRWYWGWNLAVMQTSQHHQEAKQLALWLGSVESNLASQQQARYQAASPRQQDYQRDFGVADGYAKFVAQQLLADMDNRNTINLPEVGLQFVPIPEFPAIGYQVANLLAAAVRGEISVEEALYRAQRQTEKIMLEAGYYD